nr:glycoside hydrolase [Clostridia bacterium]
LSTVDQTADYYTVDGYWNGAVWMPHQWFAFKALLDLGRAEEAWRIADTALTLWQNEVDTSYHCFEHFIVESGRGAGWHQFSALSTPVLYWFGAYHRPGHLTAGMDTWIHSMAFNEAHTALETELALYGAAHRTCCVIAAMEPGHTYRATFGGMPVEARIRTGGAVEVLLPNALGRGVLRVAAEDRALDQNPNT